MWQWVNAHGRCILYPATNCCIGAIVDYGILCGFVQGSIYHYVGFLHCPSRLLRASEKACSSWDGQGESHVSVLWRSNRNTNISIRYGDSIALMKVDVQ